ncbi:MAG: ATP-binding protein [Gaiella sp.]
MTLRRRLALAFVAIALILAGAFVVIGFRQQAVLTGQLDGQLEALARNAWRLTTVGAGGPPAELRTPVGLLPDGAYIGVFDGATLRTIARAEGQEKPEVSEGVLEARANVDVVRPFRARAELGGPHLRVTALRTPTGWLVVGLSAERVESTIRQLAIVGGASLLGVLAVLGLLLWWVDRLGLRPIGELTAVAELIARGSLDERVTVADPATEAGRLGSAFNAMADARQTAERSLRRFVADASHELRTPLTTLRGYAALHRAGGLPDAEAAGDAMRRIGQEADRMSALVDELLQLAALDERRPLDLRRTDIAQIVRDAGADAQAVQPARPIEVCAAEPACAEVDANRITQVVTALVANALAHTSSDTPVVLTARADGRNVVIEVRDRGAGIPAEHLDHVFERFYRADPARQRSAGSSGLGLSIVKAIVEAHEGTVTVESDGGALFTVVLPARASAT